MSVQRCPMCDDVLVNQNRCDCGWKRAGTERKAAHAFRFARMVGGDYVDAQCVHYEDGIRCESEGHLSDSRTGHGPFFCSAHYRVSKKDPLGDYVTKTRAKELVGNCLLIIRQKAADREKARLEADRAAQAEMEARKRLLEQRRARAAGAAETADELAS